MEQVNAILAGAGLPLVFPALRLRTPGMTDLVVRENLDVVIAGQRSVDLL